MNMRRYVTGSAVSMAVVTAVLSCFPGVLFGGELPEKCRLVPVNGPCKAMMDRYFFNQKTGHCTEYIYDGCGTVVPFETLDACRTLCEPVPLTSSQVEPPAVQTGGTHSGLTHDPVEDDPRYAGVFKVIDDEVKVLLADHPLRGGEGFVNIYWSTKKSVLKQKYGIDWRTPGELNPQVIFD